MKHLKTLVAGLRLAIPVVLALALLAGVLYLLTLFKLGVYAFVVLAFLTMAYFIGALEEE